MTLPQSLRSIGSSTFFGCSQLTEIVIPEGVTEIPDSAFNGCTKLETVTLPTSLKRIGVQAFFDCSSLITIEIPEGVTEIGEQAFDHCFNIKKVVFLSSVPPAIGSHLFPYKWGDTEFTVYVPRGSLEAYRSVNDDYWQSLVKLDKIKEME